MLFSGASLLAACTFLTSTFASPVLRRAAQPDKKLAVYYGQGSGQKTLGNYCNDNTIDIIPIGFVTVLPGQSGSVDGYPGLDFGNQCGGGWIDPQGHQTGMFQNCFQMIPDIKTCQQNGKKILLSIGGASTVYFQNDQAGSDFADFMWGAFGPYKSSWAGPRPFGNDIVLDGFDFDIETLASKLPANSNIKVDTGMAAAANRFRAIWKAEGSSHLLTAAPQCVVPDANLQNVLKAASFDAVFVQFYNTASCSARSYFDKSFGNDISYDSWITWLQSNSANPAIKAFIGLPASGDASSNSKYYLTSDEAKTLMSFYGNKYPSNFGGVMLWEMTFSANNQNALGESYAKQIRNNFNALWPSSSTTTTTTTTTATKPATTTTTTTTTITTATPTTTTTTQPATTTTTTPTITAATTTTTTTKKATVTTATTSKALSTTTTTTTTVVRVSKRPVSTATTTTST